MTTNLLETLRALAPVVDWRAIDAARAIIAALPKESDNAHD